MLNTKILTDKIFWTGVVEGMSFTFVALFAAYGFYEFLMKVFG